ncbi:MAG: T9SS type A sorting domain-containing protein [Fluviicola sp.]
MNKFLFSLVLIFLTGLVHGQLNTSHRGKTPNPRITHKQAGVAPSTVQSKSIIWSSTFSNPLDWLIGNSASNNANWEISYAPSFWWSGNAPLASNSGGNAASFNSDSFAQAANQIENNAWIQSTPFSCSNDATVAVTFQQFFNKWTGRTFIQVSNNGGLSWVDYEVNAAMENNDETPNPQEITVDITATAALQQEVMIRFLYLSNAISDGGTNNLIGDGWDYGWIVDDVVVAELPDDDVALVNAWHANVMDDYEYSMTPLSQTREIIPCAVISNEGANTQSFVLSATITRNGTIVNQATQPVSLPYGATDTIWFNSGYTPDSIGEYNVSFSVPFDQDTSDNSISAAPLYVNADVMAHDYGNAEIYGWDPNSTNQAIVDFANAPHSWGNIYIPETNETLYGVEVNFAIGTTPGLPLLVRVQRFDQIGGIQGNLQLVTEQFYTVLASDIGSAVTTIPLAQPAMLIGGAGYIIDVFKVDGTSNGEALFIGGSENASEDDDYATVAYGSYGQGSSANYYTNWGFSPLIRANFDQVLGVEHNETSKISIYPNPTSGIISIQNPGKVLSAITVTNLEGRQILHTEINGTKSLDLSNNASGIYLVTVSNEKGTSTKRIVLK